MSDTVKLFKDDDGYIYRFPDRDCLICTKYPCIPELAKLKSNFAKYGCRYYIGKNHFDGKPRK